jgi:uncharacterized protein
MITRVLLLIAIGVIVYILLRRWLARKAGPAQPLAYTPMVSCMSCGLHLPRDSAIERAGRYYCCREHADQSGR